jgi:hypothetical protein
MLNGENLPIQTRNSKNLVHSNYLLRVNTSEQGTAYWDPEGLPTDPPIRTRAEGGLVWIPAGDMGMLVAIGGTYNGTYLYNTTYKKENPEVSNNFTHEISLYDIANRRWYIQNIDANSWSPGTLVSFCAIVATEGEGMNRHRESTQSSST